MSKQFIDNVTNLYVEVDRGFEGGPCWEGVSTPNSDGYCKVKWAGVTMLLHRAMYALWHGDLPLDATGKPLVLDHLCRNRRCCCPLHLEAIGQRENVLRGHCPNALVRARGICKRGHDLRIAANVYVRKDGRERCRCCMRLGQQERSAIAA